MKKSSITVIIPAFNEEGNLSGTFEDIVPLLEKHFNDYEVLVYNDFSTDRTGPIADEWAKKNPKIKVIHNPKNMGLGFNYLDGVKRAAKDYIIMVPGDNEITGDSYETMFNALGPKDIIIPYTVNTKIRPPGRQVLSKAYTILMNFLFGLKVKYYNGTVIHKRSVIQSITIETHGFAYQAEALIKLIKAGRTYDEVEMYLKERRYGRSKALHPRNVYRVLKTIATLWWKN